MDGMPTCNKWDAPLVVFPEGIGTMLAEVLPPKHYKTFFSFPARVLGVFNVRENPGSVIAVG
jgi:hypothetical protein